ncbi:MAG: hypothetical protein H5T86_01145 [Armatimonadetes bacterium]|nr:hypothetical protein [Armatimonadota bacterium]
MERLPELLADRGRILFVGGVQIDCLLDVAQAHQGGGPAGWSRIDENSAVLALVLYRTGAQCTGGNCSERAIPRRVNENWGACHNALQEAERPGEL